MPFRAALCRPMVSARGRIDTREGFVLELRADSGQRGLGEASPAYWIDNVPLSDTQASLERIVASVEQCRDGEEVRAAMLGGGAGELTRAAACALDTALLDLAARLRGISVSAMLGGVSSDAIPVCAFLWSRTPDALTREARSAHAKGYTVFKLKVGSGPLDCDLANVNALRHALGESGLIRLDANRAWNFAEALSILAAIGPAQIEFVEEPLSSSSPVELVRLSDATGIAVALDESIESASDLEAFRELRVPALVLKAARVGGPSKCLEIVKAARAIGVAKIVITDSMETAVGMSAAIHLAASLAPVGTAVGLGGAESAVPGSVDGVAAVREASWVYASGPGLSVSAHHLNL